MDQNQRVIPSRYLYMVGILDGLRSLGGAAGTHQIYDWLVANGLAYTDDLTIIQSDGGTRFHKEVRWARKELFDANLIDAPGRGVWALTASGATTHLDPDLARAMVSQRASLRRQNKAEAKAEDSQPIEPSIGEDPFTSYREDLAVPTTGPVPVNWSGEVTRTVNNPSWTYLLRFGGRNVWKVGHTTDLAVRLADVNRHIPTEVLGEAWTIVASKKWPDALQAYQMEQSVLKALNIHRSIGERVSCDSDIIFACWDASSQTTDTEIISS